MQDPGSCFIPCDGKEIEMKKEKSELTVGKKHRNRGGGEIQKALIFIGKVWNKQAWKN